MIGLWFNPNATYSITFLMKYDPLTKIHEIAIICILI